MNIDDLKAKISDLALEMDKLNAMQNTPGWGVMDAQAKVFIDTKMESLVKCNPGDLQKIQGQIEGIRQIMGHSLAVAAELERLETILKGETTE